MGMNRSFDPEKTMNGTFGYAYIDGDELIELKSFKAETAIVYGDIKQPGNLSKGKKMLETEGTGEFVINTIDHRVLKKVADLINQKRTPKFYITGIQDDPDADVTLAYGFKNCTIENIPWFDFQEATESTQTIKFSFTDVVNINPSEV